MFLLTKKPLIGFMFSLFVLALTGCGSDSGAGSIADNENHDADPGKPKMSTEPVTLTVFPYAATTDQEFKMYIADPVSKKFPNITVELLQKPRKELPNLIAAGETPDLLLSGAGHLSTFKDMDLLEDISPLIQKQNVDVSRFEPIYFESEFMPGTKAIYGLPYSVPYAALFYNKDLFDKFAAPYPKDGMTWDEVLELGSKVTRQEGGVQYHGFLTDMPRILNPLSLHYMDPDTGKSIVASNDSIKKGYEIYQRMISIPGNRLEQGQNKTKLFFQSQVAMLATLSLLDDQLEQAANKGLNWDVAQFPSYPELRNKWPAYNPQIIEITKSSKHQDAAMQVVDVLTSEEVQMKASANGILSPLKSRKVKDSFGADMAYAKGKSLQSIFKSSPAKFPLRTDYFDEIGGIVNDSGSAELEQGADVNTVLRDIDEKVNQFIQEQKQK